MKVESLGIHRLVLLGLSDFVTAVHFSNNLKEDECAEDFDNALLWLTNIKEVGQEKIEPEDKHSKACKRA